MHSFEWLLGFRYLLSRKKHVILRLTTFISVLGVATGVLTLIVVMSVMNGFGNDLKNKVLNFKSHIVIESKDFTPFTYDPKEIVDIQKSDARITEARPYILSEMLIRYGSTSSGVLLKGVERLPEEKTVSQDLKLPHIWLGQELAQTLGAFHGDVINMVSPIETTGPLGTLPKMRKYWVAGLINTGVYEYDTKLAYISLTEAQNFLDYGRNKIDGIEIKVSKLYETPQIVKHIQSVGALSQYNVRDWQLLNRNLFSALKLEKIAMFVVLSFIVLVATLNIVTTITRIVLEKKKEIAILKTMGAQKTQILKIFLLQGIWIGLTGIGLGVLGGFLICYALDHFQLIRLPDIYYNTSVPIDMELRYFVMIGVTAFLITLLASLYPAWKASKLDPLDGIRY